MKILLATAAFLASGAAGAQTGGEVFGVVDLGLRVQGGMLTVSNGGLTSSRLGLRGVKQLSEDLSTGYWMETGVLADTGALSDPSRLLSRRGTLSLQSRTLGELRVGRDFSPAFQAYSRYDVFDVNGIASFYNCIPTGFIDQQVSYFSPPERALQAQVTVATPDTAGKLIGARMNYISGPWDGSLAYQRQQGSSTVGVAAFGYQLQAARITGIYGRTRNGASTLSAYQLGAQLALSSGQLRVAMAVGGAVRHLALGYVSPLSRRTTLYATLKAAHNPPGAELGMRHTFLSASISTVA